jgi:aminoglycoside/choline kinase family phosphotransferase
MHRMQTSPASSDSPNDSRLEAALGWARNHLPFSLTEVSPVSGDASFRRYFRLHGDDQSLILMDSPPASEDNRRFIDIGMRLRQGGAHAPEIFASNLEEGFLLLEDLGDTLYRQILHTNNADQLFPPLFGLLQTMATRVDDSGLPEYNRDRLVTELELFPHWYLERHKQIQLSCEDWDIWEALCTHLISSARQQPQVFVHRDFHSCNLLALKNGEVGVIDFQDAVRGPLSYDLISLLWDRYISWPRAQLESWMEEFRQQVAADIPAGDWVRYCDWMGLQRNLKIVGIFARLHYRDGKAGYLEMIPRFWSYLMNVLPLYEETRPMKELLERLECAP